MSRPRSLGVAATGVALVVITFAAFSGVLSSSFLNYDDDTYVTANAHVLEGLSGGNFAWALTSTEAANWHPVTWLSHMLDVQLYGLDAAKHHRTNLLLHALNAVLLFLLLVRMTGALWRPAFVATLFAIHPLHVESVAWIAERKDVLSTLFWLLTIGAWLRYVESKTATRYALVLTLFALGLASKPMLVTLPFTLLLLDYWPLKRAVLPPLWKEKLPLFAMSAGSCLVTVIAQRRGGAFETLSGVLLPARVANAAVAYVSYLGKTFWPASLAIFYPYPGSVPVWPAVGSALLLVGVTVLALRLASRAPFLVFGWLWFLGTLVPVLGLVQVGAQATADRYTYVPLIGVFIAMAWGLAELANTGRSARYAAATLSVASLAALLPVTREQVRNFNDNVSVFEHALAVTSNNFVAHANLGLDSFARGRTDDAIAQYTEALRIKPDFVEAHNNLGLVFRAAGRNAEAVDQFQQALVFGPDSAGAHSNLGDALASTGQVDAAIEHFNRALQLRPDDAVAHLSLATALAHSGRFDAALPQFDEALRLKPDFPGTYYNLGVVLAERGRTAEAIERFEQALRLKPDYPEALNNLGLALAAMNRIPESIERFQEAVRLNPGFAQAHNNLGASLAGANRYQEALEQFELAVRIDPNFEQARANLRGLEAALSSRPLP